MFINKVQKEGDNLEIITITKDGMEREFMELRHD